MTELEPSGQLRKIRVISVTVTVAVIALYGTVLYLVGAIS